MGTEAPFPPIFVINLERSADRRTAMAARLDPLHVPYTFFKAVNGHELDIDTLAAYDKTRRRLYFGKDLTKGEIGCLLSHRAVYQHMVDNNIENAIVLEDDVFIEPTFPQVVREIIASPVAWDIVRFLAYAKVQKIGRNVYPLPLKPYNLARIPTASGGAYCYMLNLKAARRLLEHMQTNYLPIDALHSYVWRTHLETFILRPSPVSADLDGPSTIGETRFDKKTQLTGWQKNIYPLTRFWLKASELVGKRTSYWSAWLRDRPDLSQLLAAYPRLVAAGVENPLLQNWLTAHARNDHVVLPPGVKAPIIRANNAQIIMLAGTMTDALKNYRSYRHANFILLPLDGNAFRLKALLGWVRYVLRGKMKPAGLYRAAGTYWLALRNKNPRSQGERVYAPAAWGLDGFLKRLNDNDCDYALLRWWEQGKRWPVGEDTDILTTDMASLEIRRVLNDHLGTVPIDLYSVSGGEASGGDAMAYYPPQLAQTILKRAEKGPHDCRIPCKEDAFYSLAYHALYHKGLTSGLPTETGLEPEKNPRHDYKTVLTERAQDLGISTDYLQSMEKLDKLLAEKGWQPPKDMLSRYSLRNPWVKKYFFADGAGSLPPGLCVFILREAAEKWNAVDAIEDELKDAGFTLLEKYCIPEAARETVSGHLRGGNWSPGPWPAPGGRPAMILVMADPAPQPVRNARQKKAAPNVDNVRILFKSTLRDKLNARQPANARANFIHTSDNTAEALDYMHILFPPEKSDALYKQFLDLRAANG